MVSNYLILYHFLSQTCTSARLVLPPGSYKIYPDSDQIEISQTQTERDVGQNKRGYHHTITSLTAANQFWLPASPLGSVFSFIWEERGAKPKWLSITDRDSQ